MAAAAIAENAAPAAEIDDAAVAAALSEAGYELVEIERDDGEIEATARKDGALWEVEIDPQTGAIAEVEREEGDDPEDDDDDSEDGEADNG